MDTMPLGQSGLQVSRLGVGAMTWGDPHGLARFHPPSWPMAAAHGRQEEQAALEASWPGERGCSTPRRCTAAARSERRLGELGRNKDVILATKFPSGFRATAESMPRDLDASIRGWDALICISITSHQSGFPFRA